MVDYIKQAEEREVALASGLDFDVYEGVEKSYYLLGRDLGELISEVKCHVGADGKVEDYEVSVFKRKVVEFKDIKKKNFMFFSGCIKKHLENVEKSFDFIMEYGGVRKDIDLFLNVVREDEVV